MKVRVDVDTKTFVRFWLVVIGFALAGLMIYSARTGLMLVGAALFLALALYRPVDLIVKYIPGKSRVAGTAVAFVSIIVLLGGLIWFVIPPLVEQSAKFAQTIPSIANQANDRWDGLRDFIDKNGLRPQVDSSLASLKDKSGQWAANAGENIISGVGSLASLLASTFLVLVMTFLMLVEGPRWMKRIWGLYQDPDRMEAHKQLVGRMYNVVTGYITGQLTVSFIGSLAAGLCVFILSLFFPEINANLAMPVILITFVLTLIPMFGATIAGVLVTALLMFNSPTAGIIYAIFFILYQQIENNFISPAIQAKKLELSALAVLVSVTIGLYMFGLVGGVIAIPIAGCIKVLLEDYLSRSRKERKKNKQPIRKVAKKIKSEA